MKNLVPMILLPVVITIATLQASVYFDLPFGKTYGWEIVKDNTTKVIQERIEEYKKVSNLESDITKAIETGSPSVVSIITTKDLAYYMTDPFSFFFGTPRAESAQTTQKVKVGWGSGIIVSKDGYIITNKHVISDPNAEYTVVTTNWETLNVKQTWMDPVLDIAVLKVEDEKWNIPTDLQPATFISYKSSVNIGQFTIAIGNALAEYANTATFGIISAKNRALDNQWQNWAAYIGLYQTDTPINPGNSGWPLLNTAWQVIWMNTAVAQWEGIGFAVPLSQEFIQTTLSSLQDDGTITRPYLGIQSKLLTKSAAKNLEMQKFEGIYIESVQPTSPASLWGLLSGDVITEINWASVQTDMPILYSLYTMKAWDKVALLVYRKKEYIKVDITLWSLWETFQ